MKINLSGKKALVGGSSKGIGLGIARQLAESGASVCLMARDKNKLEEIINELPKNNYQDHEYLLVDFSNFQKFKSTIKEYLSTNSIAIKIAKRILFSFIIIILVMVLMFFMLGIF